MLTKEIEAVLALLRDENLIWSSDLEDIKLDLANLLLVCAAQGGIPETLANGLARKILGWKLEQETLASFEPDLERR